MQKVEQQSASEVQNEPAGRQQLQPERASDRQAEVAPSGVRHDTGSQAAFWTQGSHGAGQRAGSQVRPPAQGWLAEHGMVEHDSVGDAGSRQNPQPHVPEALQLALGIVLHIAGHGSVLS